MARANYKQLKRDDRVKMEALLRAGHSKKEVAALIGCHLSTVYREYDRGKYEHLNSDYTTEWRYSADKAEAVHELNATAKGAPLKIGSNFAVVEFIEHMIIDEHYSPAAICALLREEKYEEYGITFCRATIYKYIDDGNIFLNVTNRDLPERGERKRQYKTVKEKKAPRGRSIEERPPEIESREEPGHWEMDTVVGKSGTKARLLVLSERATRREIIIRIKDGRAETVQKALDRLERLYGTAFYKIFKTITVDNGSEFGSGYGIEKSCRRKKARTTVYFCHPYTSCERGTNENINRMIRRRFPKGTDFDSVTASQVREVEDWINNYPREILGFKSASFMFAEAFSEAA